MKKIFLLMFLMVFLIGNVSALEIDNKLTYSENDMKVELNNWFGLGTNYGSAELKSHKVVNEIKKVGTGNQTVMWYDFDFKEIYKNGLGDVQFINEITGEIINRDYWFVYEDNIIVNDTITEEIYKTLGNGTEVSIGYKSIVVGNHQEKIWKPYNSKDIPSDKIRIGLKTFVEFGDLVDGIWTIGGKKVSKHSVWTNALNPSLENYYKFDVINATLNATYNNITGTFDFDIVNDTIVPNRIVAGKISNAFNFSSSNGCVGTIDDFGVINHTLDLNDTFTFNWWYKQELFADSENPLFISTTKEGGASRIELGINSSRDISVSTRLTNNTFEDKASDRSILADTFVMITFVIDENNVKVYLNGTEVINGAINTGRDWTSVWVHTPRHNCHASGIFDELGIWIDRALTPTEITQLYNGGTGITWIPTNPVPVVTLNEPVNDATTFLSTILFNGTATDDIDLVNMSLYVNESLQVTNSSPFNNTLTDFSHTFSSVGFWNWTIEACDNLAVCVNATSRNITFQNDLAITLNQPVNAFNSTISTILFNATGSDDTNLVNMSFILNATYNGTNLSVFNNTLTQFPRTLADGFYNWTMEVCDNLGNCLNATARNFTIDATLPFVNTTQPFGTLAFGQNGGNFTFNATSTDASLDSCWYDYEFTNTTYTCNSGVINVSLTTARNVTAWVNDTLGNENSSFREFNFTIFENSQTFNEIVFEGNVETLSANVTVIETNAISTVNLIYNGTSNVGSFSASGNDSILTIDLTIIPIDADVNVTFFWNVHLADGQIINLTSNNQTITSINLDDCSVNTFVLYNYTVVDEGNQSLIPASNVTAELNLNILDVGRENFIANFTKLYSGINPFGVCLNLDFNQTTYLVDSIVKYEALSYSIEYYNIVGSEITNTTVPVNITLFDLFSADATEFKISFRGEDFVFVENALIFIDRQYISENNTFKTVELPKTDSNGQTIGHFVRNDIVYNIRVIKDNVVLATFNNIIAFCTDFTIGDCEIILEATPDAQDTFNYSAELGIVFESTPTFDNTTNTVSFSFSTNDGTPKTVFMSVERKDIFGNRTICNNTLTSASGTLSCAVNPNIDNTNLETTVFVEGELVILSNVQLESSDFGNIGFVAWFFLTFIFIFLFGNSKTEILIGLFISFAGAIALGITNGSIIGLGSAGIWVLVIVILGIWKLNKDNIQ